MAHRVSFPHASPTAMISCLSGRATLTGVRWCLAGFGLPDDSGAEHCFQSAVVLLFVLFSKPGKKACSHQGPNTRMASFTLISLFLESCSCLKISKYQFWCTSMSCNLEADISFDPVAPRASQASTELTLATSQSWSRQTFLSQRISIFCITIKQGERSTKLEQDDSAQKLSPIWFYFKICTARRVWCFVKTIFTVYISPVYSFVLNNNRKGSFCSRPSLQHSTLSQAPGSSGWAGSPGLSSQWVLPPPSRALVLSQAHGPYFHCSPQALRILKSWEKCERIP